MFTQGGTQALELLGQQGHCLHGKLLRLGRAVLSHGDFHHAGATKHVSFLLFQIKHRRPLFNVILKLAAARRLEIKASFPHLVHLTAGGV